MSGSTADENSLVSPREKDSATTGLDMERLLREEAMFWSNYIEHCHRTGRSAVPDVAVEALAQAEMKLQSFLAINPESGKKLH